MIGTFEWVGEGHKEASYEFVVEGQPVIAHIRSREPGPMGSAFGASATFNMNGESQVISATGNTPEDAVCSVQEKIDRWLA